MQLLVSWWTGVPGLPPARYLGSAKSGGSRKPVGCGAIKTHGRSVFEWKTMKGSWKIPFISQWFWGYDFCTIRDTNEDPISGPGFRQCCAVLDCCSEVSKIFTVILLCAWFVYSILWPCFRRKAPSFDFFNLLHYRRMLRTGNMTSSTWSSRPLCWLSHWWVDTAWGVFKSQS